MLASRLVSKNVNPVATRGLAILTPMWEFQHTPFPERKSAPAKFDRATLDNGVRVATAENQSPLVKVKFAVLGGSAAESSAQKGAANFLSRVAFAGSGDSTGRKIVHFLEQNGVWFNSFADREKIVYELRFTKTISESVFATVASLLASSPKSYMFDELRGDIEHDYEVFHSDALAQLNELVHEAAYGETSAFGHSRFACKLSNLSNDNIFAYRNANFTRDNLVIAASGISTADLKNVLNNTALGSLPGKKSAVAVPTASFVGGDVKVRADLGGKTNLAVAFPVPAGEGAKAYHVLVEALRARFAQKTICAAPFINDYANGGLVGIRTSGCVENASKNLAAAVAELKAIAGDAGDVTAAKNKVAIAGVYPVDRQCTGILLKAALTNQDVNKFGDARGVSSADVSKAASAAVKSAPAYAVYGATAGTPSAASVQKLFA